MARRHRRPCASVIAALAARGLVVHPGSALHKGPRSARTAPPPRPAREWSGRLRERLKRENLDLRGGVDAFWRAGTEGADSLEPQKSFALGPRSAAALQSDLEYSRKILERALSGADMRHIIAQRPAATVVATQHAATTAAARVAPARPTVLDSPNGCDAAPETGVAAPPPATSHGGSRPQAARAGVRAEGGLSAREISRPSASAAGLHGVSPPQRAGREAAHASHASQEMAAHREASMPQLRPSWTLCSVLYRVVAAGSAGVAVHWGLAVWWKLEAALREERTSRLPAPSTSSLWNALFPAGERPRAADFWWWRGAGREAPGGGIPSEKTGYISQLARGFDFIYEHCY